MHRRVVMLAPTITLALTGGSFACVRTASDRLDHPPVRSRMPAWTNDLPEPQSITPPASCGGSAQGPFITMHADCRALRGNALSSAAELCEPASTPRFASQLQNLDERDIAPPSAVTHSPARPTPGRTPVLLASVFMSVEL